MDIAKPLVQTDAIWQTLCRFFPDNWRPKAFELGACKRLRGVGSVDILLRMLLLHLADGVSLQQACTIANQAGWADISDVSLLKRLRQASEWFRWFTRELVSRHHPARVDLERPDWLKARRVKSIDATVVSEPGSTGTDWRVHYCLELFELQCQQVVLTDRRVGETVSNFRFSADDLVVGDRAYCNGKAIGALNSGQVDWVFRYKHNSVRLYEDPQGHTAFDLVEFLPKVASGLPSQHRVWASHPEAIPVRLIGIGKSEQAAQKARQDYIYNQRRKQKPVYEQTLHLAGYILVLTNLTAPCISARQILQLYRLRWQIEMAFKRLKSILGLGHLPKKDPQSCRAWLHGKLFIALLVEMMVEEARLFSPWGYPLQDPPETGSGMVPVAGT